MTKQDLVAAVANEAQIKRSEAEKALSAITEGIAQALKKDGKMTLTGFGTFMVTKRKARTGRNPATGEPIEIEAGNSIRFKPGKGLKDVVK
ncbi:MAG: HU family DNA-binding protein [Pseudomonadota bacterium]